MEGIRVVEGNQLAVVVGSQVGRGIHLPVAQDNLDHRLDSLDNSCYYLQDEI